MCKSRSRHTAAAVVAAQASGRTTVMTILQQHGQVGVRKQQRFDDIRWRPAWAWAWRRLGDNTHWLRMDGEELRRQGDDGRRQRRRVAAVTCYGGGEAELR